MSLFRTLTTLAAVAVLPAILPAADKKKDKDGPVIAHIRISGDLGEAPKADDNPFLGSVAGETFKAKLDRLDKARKDDHVKAVYLDFGDIAVGWARLGELRNAVADIRAAGKKVYAYMESGSGRNFLAALAADVVVIPPSGEVLIPGLRAEVTFYKDMFEKLHLQADFLQMGEYKGAAEPYTRSSMSPEFRKQLETVIDDFFQVDYVGAIRTSRPAKGWSADDVKKLIDTGLFTAKGALEAGLVDKLAYPEELEQFIKDETKVEKLKVVREYGKVKGEEVDMSSPLALFKLFSPPKKKVSKADKIAVIYAVGVINTGRAGGGGILDESTGVGSVTTIEAIHEADKDDTVKAIVLRVDSPGGSALASDLIWDALVKCKKPVIASMGDTAASGGYYISMAAKKIFAEPGTLTGSIGVVGGKIATHGLYEWAGLKTEVISRGANSGVMSGTYPWSEGERKVMRAMMQDIYDQFLDKALEGRKKAGVEMDKPKLLTLAGGRVWTGRQAKAAGLVDELGTLADAVAEAKKMAGFADQQLEIEYLPKRKNFFERLADGDLEAKAPALDLEALPLLRRVPGLKRHLRMMDGVMKLQGERVWLLPPYVVEVK